MPRTGRSHSIVPVTIHLIAGTSLARRRMLMEVSAASSRRARRCWRRPATRLARADPAAFLSRLPSSAWPRVVVGTWIVVGAKWPQSRACFLTAIFTMVLVTSTSDIGTSPPASSSLCRRPWSAPGREVGLFRLLSKSIPRAIFEFGSAVASRRACVRLLACDVSNLHAKPSCGTRGGCCSASSQRSSSFRALVGVLARHLHRDTSRELGQLLSSNDEVGVVSAATLRFENRLSIESYGRRKRAMKGL